MKVPDDRPVAPEASDALIAEMDDSKAFVDKIAETSGTPPPEVTLQSQVDAIRQAEITAKEQQQQGPDLFEQSTKQFPEQAQDWARQHKSILMSPGGNTAIGTAHYNAIAAGHEAYSPSYFQYIEINSGMRPAPGEPSQAHLSLEERDQIDQQYPGVEMAERERLYAKAKLDAGYSEPAPQPQQRHSYHRPSETTRVPVSAPVSREVPSYSGGQAPMRVTLTPAQREIARNCRPDLSPREAEALYARNCMRLNQAKREGFYSEEAEQNRGR
jgi:hypothetical protein